MEFDPIEPVEEVNPKAKSPSAFENAPVKNLLIMLVVIFTTPLVFIYSMMRGRIKSPLLVVGFLLFLIYIFISVSRGGISKRDLKTKIIQQTLEEITPEEQQELREKISTIREEIDLDKIPQPLYPIIDVPIDMLSINYFMFMLQSGYIKPTGEGAELVLDNYLHSKHKLLKEKSWEALNNINTEAARRVAANYQAEVSKKTEILKQKYGSQPPKQNGIVDDVKDKFQDSIKKIKDKTRH